MLTTVAGISLAGILGASLVVPATRNLFLGDVKREYLQDQLPFDRIMEDGRSVACKDGTTFRVYKLHGIGYAAKVVDEQSYLCEQRGDMFRHLHKIGVEIRQYGVKRSLEMNMKAKWPNAILTEIGNSVDERFKNAFKTEWYIVLSTKNYNRLNRAEARLEAYLTSYGLEKIGVGKPGTQGCRLTGFLQFLVSGRVNHSSTPVSTNISANISSTDLQFERRNACTISYTPDTLYQKGVFVTQWPEHTSARFLEEILAIPGELEVFQLAKPWTTASIQLHQQLKEKRGETAGNEKEAAKIKAIKEDLAEGKVALFQTQYQVVVKGKTEVEVDQLLRKVTAVLASRQVSYGIATLDLPISWFNRWPGSGRALVRSLVIDNEALSAIWPYPYSPVGFKSSPFGEGPVRLLAKTDGQPYSFQFHVNSRGKKKPLGNYVVFAPPGSGKSTLLMHLLGGLSKFADTRSFILDSNEGSRFMIEAFGGEYWDINNLELNPFDLPDTPASRHHARLILKTMAAHVLQNPDLKDIASREIEAAVDMAFDTLEPPYRRLNAVYDLAFSKDGPLSSVFAPWVKNQKETAGVYASYFNAPFDTFNQKTDSHMLGINMDHFLKDPDLSAPMVAHLAMSMKNTSSSNVNILVEEAATATTNPAFAEVVLELARQVRKLNACIGLVFQDPEALTDSPISKAVIGSTATYLFFPNPSADLETFKQFNLNDEQLNFIKRGPEDGGRKVMIVQREPDTDFSETAIVDVDLSDIGDIARFYQAGTDANEEMNRLKNKWGESWALHV